VFYKIQICGWWFTDQEGQNMNYTHLLILSFENSRVQNFTTSIIFK